jgi:hypothetical protein
MNSHDYILLITDAPLPTVRPDGEEKEITTTKI